MKSKLIIATLALTALLLGGCGRNNTAAPENTQAPTPTTPPVTTETVQPTAQPQSNNVQDNTTNETAMISEQEAKQIALNHAGLTEEQVTFVKSSIDYDNGRQNYDIEFYTHDQKEYDYEIDPYTGEILEYDMDVEQHTNSSTTP